MSRVGVPVGNEICRISGARVRESHVDHIHVRNELHITIFVFQEWQRVCRSVIHSSSSDGEMMSGIQGDWLDYPRRHSCDIEVFIVIDHNLER
mgnify:CR=1 FL=1